MHYEVEIRSRNTRWRPLGGPPRGEPRVYVRAGNARRMAAAFTAIANDIGTRARIVRVAADGSREVVEG